MWLWHNLKDTQICDIDTIQKVQTSAYVMFYNVQLAVQVVLELRRNMFKLRASFFKGFYFASSEEGEGSKTFWDQELTWRDKPPHLALT